MSLYTTITNKIKSGIDAIDNTKLKNTILQALPFWTGAIITGLVAVLYAKLFSWAELLNLKIFHFKGWLFFVLSPVLFALSRWVVVAFAPYARGSGIPQVTAAIELSNPRHSYKVNKLLSLKIIVVKVFSSLIMVIGGGVIGREGPTIHIAGSIFRKINNLLPEWWPKISKQNMIVTGAASGLAAAFNTPLGGIVFAIEELTKTHISFFKTALLTGVIISGLTALSLLGPYLYLGYPVVQPLSTWIIITVLLVAAVSGTAGSSMGKIIVHVFQWKATLKKKYLQTIYAMVCGLIIASLAYFVDSSVFGSGKNIMHTTLFTDQKYVTWYVPLLRFLGPVLSFTTGAAGGVFAPSLSAGASIGAFISSYFHLSLTDSNLIILCGMVGFLTGVTRSPFTSSIIVLEMTNSHNIIFYLMLSALLANLCSYGIDKNSLYDHLKQYYIHEIHRADVQVNSNG